MKSETFSRMNEHCFEERGISYRTNELVAGRPTLVFIHGASGSASAWADYEELLAERYNIVTYDQRGHGNSRDYRRYADYSLANLSDDLHALLRHLGDHRYILVGHSFGAIVALDYLAAHQQDLEGVVLLSPDFNVMRHFSAKLIAVALTPLPLLSYLPSFSRLHGRVDYSRFVNTGDWNFSRSLADLRNTGLRTYLYCIKQSYALDATDFLRRISVPMLLIHGTADTIFPFRNSVTMRDAIPGASLVEIPGANHILVLNHPREIADAVSRFADARIPASFVSFEMAKENIG